MSKTIPLKAAHPDMERYLEHDCYCPGEIYDATGFFYDLYGPDTECYVIRQSLNYCVVIADGACCSNQVIAFLTPGDGRKIADATRADATSNNISLFCEIADKGTTNLKIDEFDRGRTRRSLDELLSMCDFVIRD